MTKKRRKRKIKVGRLILLLSIIVIAVLAVLFLLKGVKKVVIDKKTMYLASDKSEVTLYNYDENNNFKEDKKQTRGTKVTSFDKTIEENNTKYTQIEYNNTNYYVNSRNLVSDIKDSVLEKTKYVRTSVTVYENEKDSKISSFIKKGNEISITGYDILNEDGTVNMYKISKDDITGYAIVVDIKDGALAYSSEVAKEMSPTAYATAMNDNSAYKSAIDKIKEAGIYAIGRIVVFNDVHYGKDHPEDCISSKASNRLWPSAYSRGAWQYNVELAKEAVHEMGFNEIQFDYVRFPEDAYNMSVSGNSDFKNKYDEEKAEAVQNFLFYAADQLHKEGVYLSVDVFGECSGEYVTAYGQYWPAISNIVDAISSMPYTDHFGRSVDTWSNPYQTMNNWAKGAAARQKEIPTPAVARTWITAYDTPYWKPTVIYNASKIEDQVRALYDNGLDGGFITWNSSSSLAKYEQIKSAFAKNYE